MKSCSNCIYSKAMVTEKLYCENPKRNIVKIGHICDNWKNDKFILNRKLKKIKDEVF